MNEKQYNLILTEKLHQKLKIKAVKEGKSIKEIITDLLEEYIKEDK